MYVLSIGHEEKSALIVQQRITAANACRAQRRRSLLSSTAPSAAQDQCTCGRAAVGHHHQGLVAGSDVRAAVIATRSVLRARTCTNHHQGIADSGVHAAVITNRVLRVRTCVQQ